MKNPKTSDILGIINKIAPASLAEGWDNPGLQVGDPGAEVNRIMVALDPTSDVIASAISSSCQLLVTHHPLIFKPLKSISATTSQGNLVHAAIRAGLSIVSLHTNYDVVSGGLNDLLAKKIGLSGCAPLQITSAQELVKLVLFVPTDHIEQMRSALLPYVESQGNYSDCSFSTIGEGTYTPLDGAEPYIGVVGIPQRVSEQRLEMLVERGNLPRAVKALMAAHPYEEPAYDIYSLLNEGKKQGLGRIGHLSETVSLADFAAQIKSVLNSAGLRYVGDPSSRVSKVAICCGSGASLLREAFRTGADILVTGDVKYHDARDAQDIGIALIDAGHFSTEIIMVAEMAERIGTALHASGYKDCQVIQCCTETDPFRT
ncbi:MAG: Nif3-like dinuclear metal center hexameric protein [Deltaproteobacteria bacterium]|nr:Nif3-like dinuclear metal center hexameric protein [Deltaproteobacteria bacterium]